MRKLLVLLLCLGLCGCATSFHQLRLSEGYKDIKIQEGIFKISFFGNQYTSTQRVKDFALLRCAEVTLQNKYRYFTIIKSDSSVRVDSFATIATLYNQARYPDTNILIKCFKDKPEIADTIIYDAEQVKNNLKNQYQIK